jgi:site-specific DNA-methyltransferase (adenine-specific)
MHGCKLKRDVIINSVANTKDIDHPAVFPLKVIMELIKLLSTEDNLVLDPFCGSGQVCVAAKLLNRKYLGIELKKEYCDLSENRISEIESLI